MGFPLRWAFEFKEELSKHLSEIMEQCSWFYRYATNYSDFPECKAGFKPLSKLYRPLHRVILRIVLAD